MYVENRYLRTESVYKFVDKKCVDTTDVVYYHCMDTLNVAFKEFFMKCPKCKSENLRVVEKRDVENEPAIRRRRECADCNFRFTTYERLEVPSLVIRKRDGRTETYNREKLAAGIYRALEKRPVAEPSIESIINKIEKELHATGSGDISSEKVGDLVMQNLLVIDEVAYLRFASVYKKFESLESFASELANLSNKQK